jgi:hypothetical protein
MERTIACLVATVAALALVPAASGSHTVTDFGLTVADPQAGASVNASSFTTLTYDNLTDDVKKTIGHFAPGMLANPETVPHCPQAQWLADACPADTLIGSSEAVINGLVVEKGRIYNQELLADEAGRLGIIVDAATGKLFLTAPFYVRTGSDYGLDGILDDIPRLTPGTQITKLSFTLFGTVNGRNFTRGPTSCSLKVSTGEAFAYEHTDAVSGPSSSYTPTGCDKLPFKPTFDISLGSRGTTGFNRNPPLVVKVTQQPGEAGVLGNGVTLPPLLTPDTANFKAICTQAQLAASNCPAGAKVGNTSATSPFLATPLSGPVWLTQQSGSGLPALVADLRGRVPVKITIATSFPGNKQVKSTVTNVPDLPIGSFTLALDGGATGPLANKGDLCFRSDSSSSRFRTLRADVTFSGHNGANTRSTPRISVEGCGPALSGSIRRARRSKPRISLAVRRHPDGEKIARAEVVLPRELRLVRKKAGRRIFGDASGRLTSSAFSVRGSRKLRVSRLPRGGVASLSVKLRAGSVRSTRKLRRALARRRSKALRFAVVVTDAAGKRFTSRARLRARR